jgi:hypothetical protein
VKTDNVMRDAPQSCRHIVISLDPGGLGSCPLFLFCYYFSDFKEIINFITFINKCVNFRIKNKTVLKHYL